MLQWELIKNQINNNMAKPIAVVCVPKSQLPRNQSVGSFVQETAEILANKMPDYYWLCFRDASDNDNAYLEVFHENNMTETTFEELKKIVLENLKQQ